MDKINCYKLISPLIKDKKIFLHRASLIITLGFFLSGADVSQVPSGGMHRGGDWLDHPPGSLCAPACAGGNFGTGAGQPDLPPLP